MTTNKKPFKIKLLSVHLPFVFSFSLEIILHRLSHNMNLRTFCGMPLFSQFPFLDFLNSVITFVLVDTTGLVSFWDKISLYKPGWSGNCYVDMMSLNSSAS